MCEPELAAHVSGYADCLSSPGQALSSKLLAQAEPSAEALQLAGVSNFKEFRWFNVGYSKLQGEDLNYFGIEGLRVAGGQGIGIIAICQVCIIAICQVCCPCSSYPSQNCTPGSFTTDAVSACTAASCAASSERVILPSG